ncbi:PulJ/GspJ family protein [Verminephrobacter aporrectodeae]|uniref:PulJ/GspJ family protein n=1 Tax=Verminephrobacter aporrectodeae TaxID=1110389 RepID=UPI003908950F
MMRPLEPLHVVPPGGHQQRPGRAGCALAPTRRARGRRGFTLIELLVAIGVMALLAILSWRGLDGMLRAQETTRQRADELLVLQAALSQWGTDLDAVLPIANTTALDWDGQVLRLTRRSGTIPDIGALVVAWTRRSTTGQWLRWQSPPLRTRAEWQQAWQQAAQWARTPGEAERRHETALLTLDDWQIFYSRGGAWSNPLSSSDGASGSSAAAVPDGVRLRITLPAGQALAGLLTRDWVNPVLGGERS